MKLGVATGAAASFSDDVEISLDVAISLDAELDVAGLIRFCIVATECLELGNDALNDHRFDFPSLDRFSLLFESSFFLSFFDRPNLPLNLTATNSSARFF